MDRFDYDEGEEISLGTFGGVEIFDTQDLLIIDIKKLNQDEKIEIIALLDMEILGNGDQLDLIEKYANTNRVDTFFSAQNEIEASPFHLAIEGRINELEELISYL